MRILSSTASALFALTLATCVPSPRRGANPPPGTQPRAAWVVIAPHPDDEALIASGVLLRAVRANQRVAVIIMTNGDLDCLNDGLGREDESVAGLSELGVPESSIYFMGYPDGGLGSLGASPLPLRKRVIEGECVPGNTTYGNRGAGAGDYHSVHFGVPAVYTRDNAVSDLAGLLAELRPENVLLTHPDDTHPDHASTYAIFRSALDRLAEAPRVHRAIVHNDDCWPTGTQPREPCPASSKEVDRPMPELSGRLEGYPAGERLPVPADCRLPEASKNPKLLAIAAHVSQTRATPESYLFGFARSDEVFFPETFERAAGSWHRTTREPRAPGVATDLRLKDQEHVGLRTGAPFSAIARFARPAPRRGEREALRLSVLADASGDYTLEIDADRVEARLVRRRSASAEAKLLQAWPLPHDLWRSTLHETFELRVDPRPEDGPVAELSLYLRNELVGVTIDVRPRTRGEWIAVSGLATGVEQGLVVRATPTP